MIKRKAQGFDKNTIVMKEKINELVLKHINVLGIPTKTGFNLQVSGPIKIVSIVNKQNQGKLENYIVRYQVIRIKYCHISLELQASQSIFSMACVF